ncbi:Fic family protein [Pseudomonas sp. P5_152]|uniref:Fic family protein n=1 Tax=unclassified Pseudomonas TaxID=196821 RepID=UPI00132056D9|nr:MULTISPECIES: Fic family protein [unclassified Pseudomonas]MDX9668510.1 Fic family protein [Pseudomonas sp. P5_152]QHD01252.1 cell filamentation protein Fic [Pseudomonas sp. S04]QHF33736.1 cell filamentation protein Fic [Pseudomonas sp. S19]
MQVGFKVLADRYGIALAQPLRVESVIGTTRMSRESDGHVERKYPASYQPADDFAGHFEFGLKYEEVHLEFFARLFAVIGPKPIEAWCQQAPFGQYARRTGFLYEWLTGQQLAVPDVTNGGYIDAVSPQHYLTRVEPLRIRRWRINDNLPGVPQFSPLIRRTEAVQQALQFDLAAALSELNQTFGADILIRTASWLTLKESRASFLIEREADKADRIQRFAHVIAKYCGHIKDPLSNDSLHTLQAGILGHEAFGLGLRRSPVFVGQATMREDIVHYIAPQFELLTQLLDGLKAFELATRGAEPLARAAAIAFAFVYIHPMRDGNGRIHRFLINDTLIRDKAMPDGVILPVSATITSSIELRARYDRTLEVFSRPFMQRYASSHRFAKLVDYEDGTTSNLVFDDYDDAQFAWRYPDLTEHVLYTAQVVAHTVRTEMAEEARVLVIFQHAQERLKEVLEMPDQDANRIIRSLKENGWRVSGKLKKTYPQLDDAERAERVVEAVRYAFEERAVGSDEEG